ncbi:hypothetical protein [Picrophilus oshimae]|uniref:Uncharacterized protein n=1 Tax=Picrophilus torridus (strain ATCC 700027 / DSM 9790 / JCM 10055 / NBRC 100828 / KAW 2/3) TaxID=1122961 RepID=A0A8G2FWP5_PICTO|nr:hypothetical protein [Picrophilus oshimae]SMD30849.1 hypothetical protein SAMN02745355_0763 [Picrophilus oshimae DSM 9789]
MRPIITKIIIIIIAIIIIIPSAYFISRNISSSTGAVYNYSDFIPKDQNIYGYVNYNGTTFYFFASNNSIGIVTGINSIISKDVKISNDTRLKSSNVSVSEISYRGKTIYEIKDLNISGIIPFNLSLLKISNFNLYAFIENNNYVVLGNLNGVKASINAVNSGKTFNTNSIKNGNATLMAKFNSTYIKAMMYENSTYIYIYNSTMNPTINSTLSHIFGITGNGSIDRYINIYEKKNYTEIYIKEGINGIYKKVK